MTRKITIFLGLIAVVAGAIADEVQIRADNPGKYTVVKGDTLWDISGRFLEHPWQWPEIWQVNPQIANPHLIYPGDVVTLQYRDGRPILTIGESRNVKLSPTIRETRHEDAIQALPLDAVQQFLSRPRVVSEEELARSAYIVGSQDNHLTFGRGGRVYVRNLGESPTNKFSIFREGPAYRDPGTGALLGFEAEHVGDALIEKFGDPATAFIVSSRKEVLKGDRLMPQIKDEIPVFVPHAPPAPVAGKIISVIDGVSKIGQHQVVVLNRGSADGLEPGHVLAIFQDGDVVEDNVASEIAERDRRDELIRSEKEDPTASGRFFKSVANDLRELDRKARKFVGTPVGSGAPVKVKLPEERAGELMVFRIFDNVSYGLVMNIQRPVHIHDNVRNP